MDTTATTIPRLPARALHPSTITPSTFRALLALYPLIIARISSARIAKVSSKNTSSSSSTSLADHDTFRYTTLPAALATRRSGATDNSTSAEDDGLSSFCLHHDELVSLMAWKLAHGTFRPGLLARVARNGEAVVRKVTGEGIAVAVSSHSSSSFFCESRERETKDGRGVGEADLEGKMNDLRRRIKVLSSLDGVGPATASLILAVAWPREGVFFGDEIFRWVCLNDDHRSSRNQERAVKMEEAGLVDEEERQARKGLWRTRGKIGYTLKEYEGLVRKVGELRRRLERGEEGGGQSDDGAVVGGGVQAVEVEKVAFVLGNAWEEIVAIEKGEGEEAGGAEEEQKLVLNTSVRTGTKAAGTVGAPDDRAGLEDDERMTAPSTTGKRKRDGADLHLSSSKKEKKVDISPPTTRRNFRRTNRPGR